MEAGQFLPLSCPILGQGEGWNSLCRPGLMRILEPHAGSYGPWTCQLCEQPVNSTWNGWEVLKKYGIGWPPWIWVNLKKSPCLLNHLWHFSQISSLLWDLLDWIGKANTGPCLMEAVIPAVCITWRTNQAYLDLGDSSGAIAGSAVLGPVLC